MTESVNTNYEIVVRDFNGKSTEFLKKDNQVWVTAQTIASGLGINKYNVLQIFANSKALLEKHSTNMKIISVDNKRREVRVFNKTAFIWIAVRSNSPIALPFQQWVLNVIDEIMTKGFYFENETLQNYVKYLVSEQIEKRFFIHKKKGRRVLIPLKLSKLNQVLEFLPIFHKTHSYKVSRSRKPELHDKLVLQTDFVRAYDKWALTQGYESLISLTELGRLQSKLLGWNIRPTTVHFTNEGSQSVKNEYAIIFFEKEVSNLLKIKNIEG